MHEQHGRAHQRHLLDRIEGLRDQQAGAGQLAPFHRGQHRADAGEAGLDDQTGERRLVGAGREVDGDGAAQAVAVDEAARRVGLAPGQLPQAGDGVLLRGGLGRQARRGRAEAAIVDRQHRIAHAGPALDSEGGAIQIPSRAMQIQHRGRVGARTLPVPGAHAFAAADIQVEDFGAGGGSRHQVWGWGSGAKILCRCQASSWVQPTTLAAASTAAPIRLRRAERDWAGMFGTTVGRDGCFPRAPEGRLEHTRARAGSARAWCPNVLAYVVVGRGSRVSASQACAACER